MVEIQKMVAFSFTRELDDGASESEVTPESKKRRVCQSQALYEIKSFLPSFHSNDYFIEPSLEDLISFELVDPGYCEKVRDFTVGRIGYGSVRFLGETDVRWLDLDHIVEFNRHEVVVYKNEYKRPKVGMGLNKAAVVTLILQSKLPIPKESVDRVVQKLKNITHKQGAEFLSFTSNGEWKFLVQHFSRFGLNEDDEDDIIMNDTEIEDHPESHYTDNLVINEKQSMDDLGMSLSHSLPTHLRLDPIRVQEMRMLMFSREDIDDVDATISPDKQSFGQGKLQIDSPDFDSRGSVHRPTLQHASKNASQKISPLSTRKTPQPLLEYKKCIVDSNSPSTILLTGQNKGLPLRTAKVDGFRLELKYQTPINNNHSRNIVDAALFMGKSFRVGWGPNGILLHTGLPVGKTDPKQGLSSVINIERIAVDAVVRDEDNKVKKELIDHCFLSPLKLHKTMRHETRDVRLGSFTIKLQKLVSNRFMLPEICRDYIGIIEKQLDVSGLSSSARTILMHQVIIWELIKVLFSEKEVESPEPVKVDDGDSMVLDKKVASIDVDPEASPLIRRAQFSYWLQESVYHLVQEETNCLDDSNYLENILLLLTGRQLDSAVELAASRGDVRLACLLSQAGGSMVNRTDMAQQLDIWRTNRLDFNFIENDRLRLYELLAGNIQGAVQDLKLDWKRYLGLLMWYHLSPETPLPILIRTYDKLLSENKVPYPFPIYIDSLLNDSMNEVGDGASGKHFDITYYLMLLFANENDAPGILNPMFSPSSWTHDPLDYHMTWHQRTILEAIGAFSSNDLHLLDMSFVSQLLSVGQCHWAIYVVLHMSYCVDYPHFPATLIREILFQHCETWSTQGIQRQFIEELGIPSEWMHEALAVYYEYYGNSAKSMEHFLKCFNWGKAHSIFMTTVAHSMFCLSKHNDVWRIVISMEEHKSEIANWDLGAGIYVDFYNLKNSLQAQESFSDLDSLQKKNVACREFFDRLNESQSIWGPKLTMDARVTYSKMAEEICTLFMSSGGEISTVDPLFTCGAQMNFFDTILSAPISQDRHSDYLQNAVSVFSFFLSETAP